MESMSYESNKKDFNFPENSIYDSFIEKILPRTSRHVDKLSNILLEKGVYSALKHDSYVTWKTFTNRITQLGCILRIAISYDITEDDRDRRSIDLAKIRYAEAERRIESLF